MSTRGVAKGLLGASRGRLEEEEVSLTKAVGLVKKENDAMGFSRKDVQLDRIDASNTKLFIEE